MKTQVLALATSFLMALPGVGLAAKKSDEPSAISAYAGKYKGTLIVSGSGMAFAGSTQGTFTASSKKEKGSLKLDSLVNASGTLTAISESFSIRNRSLSYLLSIGGSTVLGTGSVKVGKKRITYSAVIPVSGSNYLLFGIMTPSKRGLNVTETLIIGGSTNVLTYSLKRSGKSK